MRPQLTSFRAGRCRSRPARLPHPERSNQGIRPTRPADPGRGCCRERRRPGQPARRSGQRLPGRRGCWLLPLPLGGRRLRPLRCRYLGPFAAADEASRPTARAVPSVNRSLRFMTCPLSLTAAPALWGRSVRGETVVDRPAQRSPCSTYATGSRRPFGTRFQDRTAVLRRYPRGVSSSRFAAEAGVGLHGRALEEAPRLRHSQRGPRRRSDSSDTCAPRSNCGGSRRLR